MMEHMSFEPASLFHEKWDLGYQIGDSYRLAPDAGDTIAKIIRKLGSENKTLRSFRCELAFSRLAQRDLDPILYACGSVITSSKSENIADIKTQLPIFTNVIR